MSRKINIILRLQSWMDSVPGQTFLNYAYSWGAAIVILGALFKLTHLPGANFMLFLGMGTEAVVFFLSAFDRPFDKTEEGKDLPKYYETDEEIADRLGLIDEEKELEYEVIEQEGEKEKLQVCKTAIKQAPQIKRESSSVFTEEMTEIIRLTLDELLQRTQASVSPEMEEATRTYVEKMTELNETLNLITAQCKRLAFDSEEMEKLNRTLTGISAVYELQLKSVSTQVGTIDRINQQTIHMAEQIEELNAVYARMVQALTINMKANINSNI